MIDEIILRNLLWIGALNWLVYAFMKMNSRVAPLDIIGLVAVKGFGVDQRNNILLIVQLIVYLLVGVAGVMYLLSLAPFMQETSLLPPEIGIYALPISAVVIIGAVIYFRSTLTDNTRTNMPLKANNRVANNMGLKANNKR